MGDRKALLGIVILIVVFVIGVVFDYLMSMHVYYMLEVREVSVDVVDMDLNEVGIGSITLRFSAIIYNPYQYTVEIERLVFSVYANDVYIGYGEKQTLVIRPGINLIVIDIVIPVNEDNFSEVIMALMDEDAQYRVVGTYDLRIGWFGLFRPFTISITEEAT